MTKTSTKDLSKLELTIRDEVVQKTKNMSAAEINNRVNSLIDVILSGKLEGEALLITKERARFFAEVWASRTGNKI